jgi:hypothetical protein
MTRLWTFLFHADWAALRSFGAPSCGSERGVHPKAKHLGVRIRSSAEEDDPGAGSLRRSDQARIVQVRGLRRRASYFAGAPTRRNVPESTVLPVRLTAW